MKSNGRDILKVAWKNFALRAQNANRNSDNHAIVQMVVLVSPDGNPILWLEPRVFKLEPRVDFDFTSLKNKLSPEQLMALLQVVAERG